MNGGHFPDEYTREAVWRLLDRGFNPRELAKKLGVARQTMFAVGLGQRVQLGTLTLVKQRLKELEREASP